MSHSSTRTSPGRWSQTNILGGASFEGMQGEGKAAAARLEDALVLLCLLYALHTCIIVQIYFKSERKRRQYVLRAIQLALSTPKLPDPDR
jgi:hypothetical protein